jgi:spermidine synthase
MVNQTWGYKLAAPLSFVVGFFSLSQELIWVRWVGFGHGGAAQSFSWVLTSFLVGISIGALIGKWRCTKSKDLVFDAGFILVVAGVFDALVLYAAPFGMFFSPPSFAVQFVLVGFAAGIKGVLFPIVHQMGTTSDQTQVGKSFSKVYGANIAGSTLGPLLTGFVLLSLFTSAQLYGAIGLLCLFIGVVLIWPSKALFTKFQSVLSVIILNSVAAMLIFAPDPIERVAKKNEDRTGLVSMIQNRQGIVHLVDSKQSGGMITFGGNVYDGRTGFDMVVNANRLDRAYLMATLHPAPKRVLVIGLSTGAWTKIIAGIPGIEHIDVVEINPAYATLVQQDPKLNDLFQDPRIHFHWGDGRRWLRANPTARYDLIFQNTTFHWRAYISLLVSQEYLTEAKTHLLPAGIMAINTTSSPDIYHTAASVFESTVRYENFVYGSNQRIARRSDAEQILKSSWVQVDGKRTPAFTSNMFLPGAIGQIILSAPLEGANSHSRELLSKTLGKVREPELITDLNLITEYRFGRSIFKPLSLEAKPVK